MTIDRRPAGHGTLETLPSGRTRARVPLADGERHTVGTYDSPEEAEAMLVAFVEEASKQNLAPVGGLTVRALFRAYHDELDRAGVYAAMANVRSIGRKWIETAHFADWPVRRVTLDALKSHMRTVAAAGLDPGTQRQVVVQLRKLFAFGVETKRLDVNPAAELRVARGKARTDEPWTYLDPAEQSAFLAVTGMPNAWRLRITFAMCTGLRANELWCLRLADLRVDGPNPEVIVRYGSRRRGTKGHKIRRVPLIDKALEAAREWLTLLPSWAPRNPNGLAFPGRYGGFEKVSRVPGWKTWLAAAGIERRVRWHDLRHTAGASLISGWWGRAWQLAEIRDFLGHHSIKETERYAHLGDTALKAAAAATRGPVGGEGLGGPRPVHRDAQVAEVAHDGVFPRHPPKSASKGAEEHGNLDLVGSAWTDSKSVAVALLRAARDGEDCGKLVVALAGSVLGSPLVALASAALAGGPHALDRALELAALIAGETEELRRKGSA